MMISEIQGKADNILSKLPFNGSKTTIGGALIGVGAILKGLTLVFPDAEPVLSPLIQALDAIGAPTAAIGISHKAVK